MFGGLWESAGDRKRGGVEEILKTFPDSRFLLVGDSGEQDVELYAALAHQYPKQVLAIYIRDVTTPVSRLGNLSANASTASLNSNSAILTPKAAEGHAHRPIKPQRRPSDVEQLHLMEELAIRDKADQLDDADEMSPNNPLDRNSIESGRLSPLDQQGYTEVEKRVLMLFKERMDRARREIPDHIPLKLFRSGTECKAEALAIILQHEQLQE